MELQSSTAKPSPRMASSHSNTLLDALEIQEPPTHFEYNFTQDCCQRLLETCSCKRPTTETKFPSTKLVMSTEGWRSLSSWPWKSTHCTQRKENLTRETSIYVNARPAIFVHFPSLGEKSKVFIFSQ